VGDECQRHIEVYQKPQGLNIQRLLYRTLKGETDDVAWIIGSFGRGGTGAVIDLKELRA
jgi:hypothetical protein